MGGRTTQWASGARRLIGPAARDGHPAGKEHEQAPGRSADGAGGRGPPQHLALSALQPHGGGARSGKSSALVVSLNGSNQ